MKKRIKKKITQKQVNLISILIGIVLGIMCLGLVINNFKNFGWEYVTLAAIAIGLMELTIVAMNSIISVKLFYKDEVKEKLQTFLSKEEYNEVDFTIPDYPDTNKMILEIIRKGEYQFFAKFAENDDIILIVKDKNGDEIYNCEMSNYFYFNAHFKRKN